MSSGFLSSSQVVVKSSVAIAVVDSIILDVIIISDITVIMSRLDWILKKGQSLPWNCVLSLDLIERESVE